MCPDDNIKAAAQFALGVKGRMPNDEARAALKSLPGAEVVRRVLAALHDDTNKEQEQDNKDKEEQGVDNGEDGFVITHDDNTKDNETLHRSPQLGRTRQTTPAALASMT
jgi:hypothetical protein